MTAEPVIALTIGDPAGIGPDLTLEVARDPWPARLVAIGDPVCLRARARALDSPVRIVPDTDAGGPHEPGVLPVSGASLAADAVPGRLDRAHARPVLAWLEQAARGCLGGRYAAMVTAPVHKGVINDAGVAFTGHTEYLAGITGGEPVMMLAAGHVRVALVTTHLPLSAVPSAVTGERVRRITGIVARDLRSRFGIPRPRLMMAGLNPHAGESGHLGREDLEVLEPAVAALREAGIDVTGPLPADTLFTPARLAAADAVICMYHDQGLPALKALGFGEAVNITLGLPIIRTSVDHGTALDLAGTGRADAGSLRAAIAQALRLTRGPAAA